MSSAFQIPTFILNRTNETARALDLMYFAIGSYHLIIAVISVVLNGLSIAAFIRYKELRFPVNSFIIALAVCDLFFSTVGMSLPAYLSFKRSYISSSIQCATASMTTFIPTYVSFYLLSAISFDRYLIIVRPASCRQIKQRAANIIIFACFACGILWSSMPLIGWNEYVLEGIGIMCTINWYRKDPLYFSFTILNLVCCFMIPISIMTFCYHGIYKKVRQIGKNSSLSVQSKRSHLERRTVKFIICIIVMHFLTWGPYSMIHLPLVIGLQFNVSPLTETLASLIVASKCIFDPIIYVTLNRNFRASLLSVFFVNEKVITEELIQDRRKSTKVVFEPSKDTLGKERSSITKERSSSV